MVISAALGAILGASAGAIGSSALGALGSYIAGWKQFEYQKQLQSQAAQLNYDYGQKSLLNNPSSTRKGLETAGYNPMLAVQNSTSGANAGWTSAGSASGPTGLGNSFDNMIANAQSFQRLKNETQQTANSTQVSEAQSDEAYAQADKAKVEKNALLQKMPYISKREKAEIGNIEKDSLLKESQIHNMDETTRFIEKRFELEKRLGEMGLNVQMRGQDKAYNASTYSANKSAEASKYGSNMSYQGNRYSSDVNERNNIRSNNGSQHGFNLFNLYRYNTRRSYTH